MWGQFLDDVRSHWKVEQKNIAKSMFSCVQDRRKVRHVQLHVVLIHFRESYKMIMSSNSIIACVNALTVDVSGAHAQTP